MVISIKLELLNIKSKYGYITGMYRVSGFRGLFFWLITLKTTVAELLRTVLRLLHQIWEAREYILQL